MFRPRWLIGPSTVSGIKTLAPVIFLGFLFEFIDNPARERLHEILKSTPADPYLFPGTGILIIYIFIYSIGRFYYFEFLEKDIPGSWLKRVPIAGRYLQNWSFGVWLSNLPYLGSRFREAIIDKYKQLGFLRPVYVPDSGIQNIDDFNAGKTFVPYRTAFFLREIIDEAKDLPTPYRKMCEVLITSNFLDGNPKTYPPQVVRVYEKPESTQPWRKVATQGYSGYTRQHTKRWVEVQKDFIPISEEQRSMLKKFGIIIED